MQLTIDLSKAHIAALRRFFRAIRAEEGYDIEDGDPPHALVLQILAAAETDAAHDKPAGVCRRCGCTDRAACPDGCGWAEENLCSACVTPAERRVLARMGG